MTEPNARAMVQLWAEMEPVKVYEPRPKQQTRREAQAEKRKSSRGSDLFDRFKRRYGILLIAAAAFTIYTIILSASVEYTTERRVRAEMAQAADQAVEDYKTEQTKKAEDAEKAKQEAGFLTGEASLQNYIETLAGPLSVHVASLRMERKVTAAGAETYAWVDLTRLATGSYGSTLEEVLSDPVQIEGYVAGHATRPEDDEIGLRVATNFVMKKFPTGYNTNMIFAQIMPDGSVEARDQYETGPNTRYFAIGK